MKKLTTIIMFAALAAVASAQATVNLLGGYREKTIELGRVVNEHGVYVTGADVTWQSFHFAAAAESDLVGRNKTAEFYRGDQIGRAHV